MNMKTPIIYGIIGLVLMTAVLAVDVTTMYIGNALYGGYGISLPSGSYITLANNITINDTGLYITDDKGNISIFDYEGVKNVKTINVNSDGSYAGIDISQENGSVCGSFSQYGDSGVLDLYNEGNGTVLNIDNNGDSNSITINTDANKQAILINQNATGDNSFGIQINAGNSSANVVYLGQSKPTDFYGAYFYRNADSSRTSNPVIRILNTNQNDDQVSLQVQHESANDAVKIIQNRNYNSLMLDQNGNNSAIHIDSESTTTTAIEIDDIPSNKSIQIVTNDKICLDGSSCNHYITYNGSCITNGTVCIG